MNYPLGFVGTTSNLMSPHYNNIVLYITYKIANFLKIICNISYIIFIYSFITLHRVGIFSDLSFNRIVLSFLITSDCFK